ncbi:MAG: AmmeMemoRadiSam system protein B [Nanoarchaeota archaeon]|nr:AmmeMemoRadiSam system protein B [Nanoarchaeota archaeon]
MREEAVAGQFYPEDPKELKEDILKYLRNAHKISQKSYGIIVPHAGYSFSGQIAANAYNAISKQKFDTFIILGTNHSSNETSISLEDFQTPLGIVKNDKRFSEELVKLKIEVNEKDQALEHSIEVQIPFLQILFHNIKIVPMAVSFSDFKECKEFSEKIIKVAEKLSRKICIISSGDLTHYGPYYNYTPFNPGRSKVYAIDRKAMDLISELRAKEFFEYCKNTTICGISSISAGIEICRQLGAKKSIILKYSNSGDLTKDYDNCVSYASLVIG